MGKTITRTRSKPLKVPKQDQSEIRRMAEFYSQQYQEVYLLRCLNCKRVIGVECAPELPTDRPSGFLVTERGRVLHTYQGLCLSVRQRLDSTPNSEPMMGYECMCGNRTTLGKLERGDVQEQTVVVDKLGKVVDSGKPMLPLSPFEQSKTIFNIKQKEAGSGHTADYELTPRVERFESFQLERVK